VLLGVESHRGLLSLRPTPAYRRLGKEGASNSIQAAPADG
jgi:hypothetical protein